MAIASAMIAEASLEDRLTVLAVQRPQFKPVAG
jgi:hypothetical protein